MPAADPDAPAPRRVSVARIGEDGVDAAVRRAMVDAGLIERIGPSTRVAIKPNLTYPFYKAGVTTTPAVIRAVVRAVRERTSQVAIVETDGGYGAWTAAEAFRGHDLPAIASELGAEVVNLCEEPSRPVEFRSRGRLRRLPLPVRLLDRTDLLITMPVPKIHCMTGLTLAYKNQWGCIPDTMRLRRHYDFDRAIVAINGRLRPAVVGDGRFFLDRNGPMDGDAVPMNLIIAASDAGAFDRYVSELMRFPWQRVGHLREAVRVGQMPSDLTQVTFNESPSAVSQRQFRLQRTARNRIALLGFRSRFMTWLGYESWFGRVVLHQLLYAVAGRPVRYDTVDRPTGPSS
jgi:uncharacterized protein (DUF362 family)